MHKRAFGSSSDEGCDESACVALGDGTGCQALCQNSLNLCNNIVSDTGDLFCSVHTSYYGAKKNTSMKRIRVDLTGTEHLVYKEHIPHADFIEKLPLIRHVLNGVEHTIKTRTVDNPRTQGTCIRRYLIRASARTVQPTTSYPIDQPGPTAARFMGRNPDVKIKSMGCEFSVYRKRKREHVVTVSFYKAKPGYIFNLSQSILLWPTMMNSFFGKEWNIRMYMDYTLIKQAPLEDITLWDEVIQSLLKWPNVELWMFDCNLFRNKVFYNGVRTTSNDNSHRNTFGSIVRFQPLFDPDVKVFVSRNLELLTSSVDAAHCKQFARDDQKKYLLYCLNGYECKYRGDVCQQAGVNPNRENMMLAMFGCKIKMQENDWDSWIDWTRQTGLYENQMYGIDEIFLWKFFKPELTTDNTQGISFHLSSSSIFYDEFVSDNMPLVCFTDKGQRIPSLGTILNQFASTYFLDKTNSIPCEHSLVNLSCDNFEDLETTENQEMLYNLRYGVYVNITQNTDILDVFCERLDGCPVAVGAMFQSIQDQIRPRTDREHKFVSEAHKVLNDAIIQSFQENDDFPFFETILTRFPTPSLHKITYGRKMQLLLYTHTEKSVIAPSDFPGMAFKNKNLTRDATFTNKNEFTKFIKDPTAVSFDRGLN